MNAGGARRKITKMKNGLTIFLLAFCTAAGAQPKKIAQALGNSKLLVNTIFETKDSATLEKLFAMPMTHINAGGKKETRAEAISNFVNNKSDYVQANMTNGYGVAESGDSTTVKFFYKGRENKTDGTSIPFSVNLVMVWVKVKKKTTLHRLETIKVE